MESTAGSAWPGATEREVPGNLVGFIVGMVAALGRVS